MNKGELIEEKTLSLVAGAMESTEAEEAWLSWRQRRRLLWLQNGLWAFCFASVLAALVVGSFYRHAYPQPELLPAPIPSPKAEGPQVSQAPSLPVNLPKPVLQEKLDPQIALRCQLALQAKRFAIDAEEPFPACVLVLQQDPCGSLALRYLETKYLLAYASFHHQKTLSLRWLRAIQAPVSRCRSTAPELAKRVLQFFEENQN